MAITLLLPLVVPLAGLACIFALPQRQRWLDIRRRLYLATLGCTLLGVLLLAGRSASATLFRWGLRDDATLALATNPLGYVFELLAAFALMVVALSMLSRPMERYESTCMLLLLAAMMGICMSANLVTLCIMWSLLDLSLLVVEIMRAPDESLPHAHRRIATGILSTIALVSASILVARDQPGADLATWVPGGLPLQLIAISALLRLSFYPAPGSLKRRWEAYLASTIAGAYLWIRLMGAPAGELQVGPWAVAACVAALAVVGFLAASAPNLGSAVPYLLSGCVIQVVLAPLLSRGAGVAVAIISVLNLVLCLALLRSDIQVKLVAPLGLRARIPLVVAMASLCGWPLTLGALARWYSLGLLWTAGYRRLAPLMVIAFLLASMPIWQRLRQIPREIVEPGVASLPITVHIPFVATVGSALPLLLLGIGLTIGAYSALHMPGSLDLGMAHSALAVRLPLLGLLALAGLGIPLLGGYAAYRAKSRMSRTLMLGVDVFGALFEFDWLYAGLERTLQRAWYIIEQSGIAIERAFYLGWTLLWALVIMLYLAGSA